jgi:hypothetical protein
MNRFLCKRQKPYQSEPVIKKAFAPLANRCWLVSICKLQIHGSRGPHLTSIIGPKTEVSLDQATYELTLPHNRGRRGYCGTVVRITYYLPYLASE